MERGRLEQWAKLGWEIVRKDMVIYLTILLYIAIAGIAAEVAGVGDRFSVLVYPVTTVMVVMVMGGSGFVVFSAYVMLIEKPASPITRVFAGICQLLASKAFFRSLPLLAFFSLFFSAASSFKTLIPAFQAFVWDNSFIAVEQWLHGGKQPWEWLQPLLGYPVLTWLINVVYNFWFFIMFLVLFWQMLDAANEVRRRVFLLCFVLIWAVNGSLLAALFSSAGPCFLDRLLPGEPNPFAGLMAYLNEVNQSFPVWALPTQDALWGLYESNAMGIGAGISAMPSMHVSVAWLIFLLVRREVAWMKWLGRIFVSFILVGSVHLGWHYAVDGYVAILTTTLIWWLVSWAVAAGEARDAPELCRD